MVKTSLVVSHRNATCLDRHDFGDIKKLMNLKSDGLYPSLLTESEIYNKSFNVLDSILKDFFHIHVLVGTWKWANEIVKDKLCSRILVELWINHAKFMF